MSEPTSADRAEITDSELVEHFEKARDAWSLALASPELKTVAGALAAAAIGVEECVRESARITEAPATRRRLEAIREIVAGPTAGIAAGSFERFVLAHAVLAYRKELQSAALPPVVKRLACSGLLRFADGRTVVNLSEHRFVALCKIATLRRFPAGQFDWERSGLPRSWLARVRPLSSLTRLLSIIAFEWRGFSPAFFVHAPTTYSVPALLEREALKSYHRMARSMALQPEVKGLVASTWLHSPATFAVSPHLAWLNKVFAEHNAVVATMGPATLDSGVLVQSVERQRAFAEGRFKPTLGLIVWPRRDVLAWAAVHQEFAR